MDETALLDALQLGESIDCEFKSANTLKQENLLALRYPNEPNRTDQAYTAVVAGESP